MVEQILSFTSVKSDLHSKWMVSEKNWKDVEQENSENRCQYTWMDIYESIQENRLL